MLNWLFNLTNKLGNGFLIPLLIVFLVFGMLFLVKGADIFVGNASSLAKRLGISSLVIGLTIVSFGTSAPEASVSITASITNSSDISISNVIGSNIFNMLVVLGTSLLFSKMIINKTIIKRDLPIMIISTVLLFLFVLSYGTGNYILSRIEGIILLVIMLVYIILTIKTTKNDNEDNNIIKKPIYKSLLFLAIGLILIILGGELVTYSAKTVALKLGVSELIVGLTIVAVGTSLPELITSIVAAKKGENEIAIGNVIGSNIFNILFILGISSTINPLTVTSFVIIDIIFFIVVSIIFLIYSLKKRTFSKLEGIILLLLYSGYLIYIIIREFI